MHSPDKSTPPVILKFFTQLRENFGYQLAGESPYVVHYDNNSKISDAEKTKYLDHKQPAITQFFCQQTNFAPGKALACFSGYHLVPNNSLQLAAVTTPLNIYEKMLSAELLKPLPTDVIKPRSKL